jgi:hypothetical protein
MPQDTPASVVELRVEVSDYASVNRASFMLMLNEFLEDAAKKFASNPEHKLSPGELKKQNHDLENLLLKMALHEPLFAGLATAFNAGIWYHEQSLKQKQTQPPSSKVNDSDPPETASPISDVEAVP